MTESTRLVDLVNSRVDEFLITRVPIVTVISPELSPFVDFSRQFLSGGKRFRALFCYWGWQSVTGPEASGPGADLSPVVTAAAALEIFHAAALVHDDIIDNSDTRRGAPSAHRLFENLHAQLGWIGGPADFGRAAAILLGDLLLGWSDELLDEGLARVSDHAAAARARVEFNLMRTEVTAGQYLDILEERAWATHPESELYDRALRVITYKSAKYSVQAPLLIGAAMAGATEPQLQALSEFGLPLGIAYQLRDDLLGVFGDAAVTGKPSGDDLREGKRTVLIALTRDRVSPADRDHLDGELGDETLTPERIEVLQRMILASGAADRVEELIAHYVARADTVLETAPLSTAARRQLHQLSVRVTHRAA
ncbi:MAG: polyprenyl synthetase family protein [Cryobacterium sp.]